MESSDKIVIGSSVIGVVSLVVVGWCYGKIQYYQGRIDGRKQMTDVIIEGMNKYESKKEVLEENKA